MYQVGPTTHRATERIRPRRRKDHVTANAYPTEVHLCIIHEPKHYKKHTVWQNSNVIHCKRDYCNSLYYNLT